MRHVFTITVVLITSAVNGQTYKVREPVVVITNVKVTPTKGDKPPKVFPGALFNVVESKAESLLLISQLDALEGLENCYFWIDKTNVVPFNKASDYFTKKIELEPDKAEWRYARALVWEIAGKDDAAIKEYSELIRRDPRNLAYLERRAKTWRSAGKHHKAIEDYDEMIRINPKLPTSYVARGFVWIRLNEHDKAIKDSAKPSSSIPGIPRRTAVATGHGRRRANTAKPSTTTVWLLRLNQRTGPPTSNWQPYWPRVPTRNSETENLR
jgi:tetratricopeptide (TPR) repeat protein